MAHIAILIDSLVGHFYPTLGLARALAARGHRVQYLGVPDIAPTVREQGCEITEIMGDLLPPGAMMALARANAGDPENEALMTAVQQRYFGPLVSGQVLDRVFAAGRPDVLLALSFLGLEALVVHYRYRLPVVLAVPFIRDQPRLRYFRALVARLVNLSSGVYELVELIGKSGASLRGLNDLADVLASWPELALYAKAFDLPEAEEDPRVQHIGAAADSARREAAFDWEALPPGGPIVYVSLGSRPGDYGGVATRFFRTLIEAVTPHPEWRVLLSHGSEIGPADLPPCPPHVLARPWVPQMDVLRRAAVMVTHAGMGAVSECILAGVPMLAFPLARDQHTNAARITAHGLGLAGDAATIAPEALAAMLTQLIGDTSVAGRVALMRERCRESDVEAGVRVLEQAMLPGSAAAPADLAGSRSDSV